MNGPIQLLMAQVQKVASRQRRMRLWLALAGSWATAALLGLGLNFLQRQIGWTSSITLPLVSLLGVLGGVVVLIGHARSKPDGRDLASQIEARHPELDGRLVTAVQ